MAEKEAYCRQEGEHSQRQLEESRLNWASTLSWAMRQVGGVEACKRGREERRSKEPMGTKRTKRTRSQNGWVIMNQTSCEEGREAQRLERLR